MKDISIEDIYPLSPTQEGLLFQSLYSDETDIYLVQNIFELQGKFSVLFFQEAWRQIIKKYPTLRAGVIWEKLQIPLQYVLETVSVPLTVYDWKNESEKLERLTQEDRKKGFDLSRAPLFRLIVIQSALNKYYFIWSQHHILVDGWCMPIIFKNVFQAYEEIKEGRDVYLKPSRPYRDYIAWLQKQDIQKAKIYWKSIFSLFEGPTHFSFKDFIIENKEKNKDHDTYVGIFAIEETEKLKSFAKHHNLTFNTLMLGTIGLVLKTYIQKQDIIIGLTVSGRNIDLPGIEEMVGITINTLPLRISFQKGESTILYLKRLQNQVQTLNEYTYTPLARIRTWVGINQRLFDVLFVFANYPREEKPQTKDRSFSIKRIRGIEKTEYPLTISLELGKQLHFILNYQTSHFDEEHIKKFYNKINETLQSILGCFKP